MGRDVARGHSTVENHMERRSLLDTRQLATGFEWAGHFVTEEYGNLMTHSPAPRIIRETIVRVVNLVYCYLIGRALEYTIHWSDTGIAFQGIADDAR